MGVSKTVDKKQSFIKKLSNNAPQLDPELVSSMGIYHDVYWVFMAMGITAALVLGLALFSFQTKIYFTGFGMYLFGACWILFLFGILAAIFLSQHWPVIHIVYSALMALLFSAFLIYDTQQILGGKKYQISPEE